MPYLDNGTGYRDRDTSAAAAHDIAPVSGTIRARVLAEYHANPFPLTADEVADRLGLEFISVRPRVTELSNDNLLRDSGVRKMGRFGKEQIAWEIA